MCKNEIVGFLRTTVNEIEDEPFSIQKVSKCVDRIERIVNDITINDQKAKSHNKAVKSVTRLMNELHSQLDFFCKLYSQNVDVGETEYHTVNYWCSMLEAQMILHMQSKFGFRRITTFNELANVKLNS